VTTLQPFNWKPFKRCPPTLEFRNTWLKPGVNERHCLPYLELTFEAKPGWLFFSRSNAGLVLPLPNLRYDDTAVPVFLFRPFGYSPMRSQSVSWKLLLNCSVWLLFAAAVVGSGRAPDYEAAIASGQPNSSQGKHL